MFNVSIPKLSIEEVLKRYQRIRPLVHVDGKLYYLREFTPEEICGISYLWECEEDKRDEVGEDELEVMEGRDFVCLIKYTFYGLFKPTVSEVLRQIDDRDLPFVRAFEIIDYPRVAEDFHKDSFTSIAFSNGYHVAMVRLYMQRM